MRIVIQLRREIFHHSLKLSMMLSWSFHIVMYPSGDSCICCTYFTCQFWRSHERTLLERTRTTLFRSLRRSGSLRKFFVLDKNRLRQKLSVPASFSFLWIFWLFRVILDFWFYWIIEICPINSSLWYIYYWNLGTPGTYST